MSCSFATRPDPWIKSLPNQRPYARISRSIPPPKSTVICDAPTFLRSLSNCATIRAFEDGDEEDWVGVLRDAYGELEFRSLSDIRQLIGSKGFLRDGLFFAVAEGRLVGSIRVKPLPRDDRYELWDLAVFRECKRTEVPGLLVDAALTHLANTSAQLARAHTLAMEPYIATYIEHGFKPVRRILRIEWDLSSDLPKLRTREDVVIKGVSSCDPVQIAGLYARSLAPFWDWWIDDHGGAETLVRMGYGTGSDWFIAEVGGEPVGLTGFRSGGPVGQLLGVVVLPECRTQGIGSTLLHEALERARRAGLKSLRVFTVAFLDRLAPGAALYLKSGGKIRAEYLQLEKDLVRRV